MSAPELTELRRNSYTRIPGVVVEQLICKRLSGRKRTWGRAWLEVSNRSPWLLPNPTHTSMSEVDGCICLPGAREASRHRFIRGRCGLSDIRCIVGLMSDANVRLVGARRQPR
jgi:hypothetical protein